MKFNQVIWDALCLAEHHTSFMGNKPTHDNCLKAIVEYARACDGKAQAAQSEPHLPWSFTFVPQIHNAPQECDVPTSNKPLEF